MPVIRETTFNAKLTDILRRKNPRWRRDDAAVAEGGRILQGGGTPDVFIRPEGAPPIRLIQVARNKPKVIPNIAKLLHQSEGEQTTRMAMAIVANALTFHAVLAGAHDIKDFDQLRTRHNLLTPSSVTREWWRIVDSINYYPIFDIARRVMAEIPTQAAFDVIDMLSDVAEQLIGHGITASHDLYGRMFQRLITDRKFLATFYTLPESAMLLAEVAVEL